VVVNERRVWLPCKVLSKLENYPRSYVVKLLNGQIVWRTSYHLRHTKGQHYIENYEDNDDIILGVSCDEKVMSEKKVKDSQSNEKVMSEEKLKDSQSNEKVVSEGLSGEITKTKVGRVVKIPTKLDIYDLSN